MIVSAAICFTIGFVGFYAVAWWLDWCNRFERSKLKQADRSLVQLNNGEITINQYRKEVGLEPLPPWREGMAVSGVATCWPGQAYVSHWPLWPPDDGDWRDV